MTEHPDYESIEVPDRKRPTEYTCHEKRAEIVRLWKESTDPYTEISPTTLSERYGNVKSTLHDDIEIVKKHLRERIGTDDELKSDLGFDRSIRNLEEQGKWFKAAKVRKLKWEWLQASGHKEKQPDKTELTGEGGGAVEFNYTEEIVETPWEPDDE
jgi:predicted RNase H-like nuclease (RuvC/YqgF family)